MISTILDINRAGHERLGYTKEEMLGHKIGEFDSPSCTSMVSARIHELFSEGCLRTESMHLHKDGSEIPIEINARMLNINGKNRVFSIIRDITERKKQAEEIDLMARVFQSSAEAMLITDSLNRIVKVNPS